MPQDEPPTPSLAQSAESQEVSETVPDENELAYDRILVPIDFSEHSKRTVAYAIETASTHNSTIYLLHVFQIPDYVVSPYARRRQSSAEVQSQVAAAEQEARESL